jgi:hypothetical protein
MSIEEEDKNRKNEIEQKCKKFPEDLRDVTIALYSELYELRSEKESLKRLVREATMANDFTLKFVAIAMKINEDLMKQKLAK